MRAIPHMVAAAGLCAGSAVQAQGNVTLYGVIDTNIEYVHNMSSVTPSAANGFATGPARNIVRMSPGGLSGSRWGLRGTEDLGGGLKTVFALESGFSVDDGKSQQGGRLFGRQAYVGLERASLGSITFGRQYTPIFDLLANFSPIGYAAQYEPTILMAGLNFRSDNTVKYTGKFGGLTTSASWTFGNGTAGAGEVAGQARRDTGFGGGATYATGPVSLALVYDQYNPTLNAAGGTGTFQKVAVAGAYDFGGFKLSGGYRWGRNRGANDNIILRDNYYWLGGNYQVTPALALTLAYYYEDVSNFNPAANGVANNPKNPWQVLFVADYSLSKRTDLYLTTAYAKNAGLNFDTSAISFANGYFLGSGKNNMFAVATGIRHKF